MKPDGVYVISNGDIIVIFIGKQADSNFLTNTWGLGSSQELFESPEYWPLRDLETEESQRVIAVIEEIRRRNFGVYAAIYYHFGELSSNDHMLKILMIEDNNATELSYGEFLMRLHKVVINKISRKD